MYGNYDLFVGQRWRKARNQKPSNLRVLSKSHPLNHSLFLYFLAALVMLGALRDFLSLVSEEEPRRAVAFSSLSFRTYTTTAAER